ncbi:HEPACAM family member 2-like isoform X2 [Scyliorhinus torazame]|uniref:HEPACAM family member 2-like isoform X2 n=1 Tax=Scyliorhinus torazame TaxID=75743 RepID=UPI003B597688
MGHDAFMDPFGRKTHFLLYEICILAIGSCGAVTITVPNKVILGTAGQPLLLPANYTTGTKDQNIQITWTFQSPSSGSMLLVTAINNTLTPDMEHGHRFFLSPPSASLLINPVELRDDGEYTLKVTVSGVKVASASRQLTVLVNVPVSKPVVRSDPAWGAVEYVDNATFTCTVNKGTKVIYQWLKDGKPLKPSSRHIFSSDNKMLFISPVLKDDLSNYTCVARNPISMNESEPIAPNIYYGPYDLMVKSEPRFKVREGVFAAGKGEPVWFKCSANSNPPNVYSWFQKADNKTTPIQWGPVLKIRSEKVPEKADYMCCVYNNITGKREETQFTFILSATGITEERRTKRQEDEDRTDDLHCDHRWIPIVVRVDSLCTPHHTVPYMTIQYETPSPDTTPHMKISTDTPTWCENIVKWYSLSYTVEALLVIAILCSVVQTLRLRKWRRRASRSPIYTL